MTIHDENWRVSDDEILLDDANLPANHINPLLRLVHAQDPREAEARLRLAAQAPAMARLLIKLAEAAERLDPHEADSVFGDDAADEIRAVLRAAGVLPPSTP